MAVFYGVYPRDRGVRAFLTLLRYVAEPTAIRSAHITIKGPLKRIIGPEEMRAVHNTQPRWVSLKQPITLFDGGQNTVGLEVELGDLRAHWEKPDFPSGVAHLTMYDGKDRNEARGVYNVLLNYHWDGRIQVSELRRLEAKLVPSKRELLADMSEIYGIYERVGNRSLVPLVDVALMPFNMRMNVYQQLLHYARVEKFGMNFLLTA